MDTINNGVTEVDTIDLTHLFSPIDITHLFPTSPSWMLTRHGAVQDVTAEEREEAAAAGVTDFDDFGIGLSYNRIEDATAVAERMANRFGEPFGVYGGHDSVA